MSIIRHLGEKGRERVCILTLTQEVRRGGIYGVAGGRLACHVRTFISYQTGVFEVNISVLGTIWDIGHFNCPRGPLPTI